MHIWMGSGDSLSKYLKAARKYEDVAFVPTTEEEDEFANPFGVSADRIGLPYLESFGKTAVLTLAGSMVNSYKWWHEYAVGEVISYDAMKDAVNILNEANDISRVIVRIESGGGMVSGLDSTAKYLKKLANNKQVVVHTDTGAMSAA